jgi:hypothetical protein
MRSIINDNKWALTIGDTIPPINEVGQYVRNVRKYMYYPPW